jgi:hypothetical protein
MYMMFTLQGAILHIFGWLMLLGSSDLTVVPSAAYTPVDTIVATQEQNQNPLFFDAVLDVSYSYTYETPGVKIFPQPYKLAKNPIAPLFYQLSYYSIGQQIVVNLSTKTIIFPFHCFT